jgi:hypothetical protein
VEPPKRIAVVAVHGVLAHARYTFQDQVAQALLGQLGDAWTAAVVFPKTETPLTDPLKLAIEESPTIVRLYQKEDNAEHPERTFFDVREAYWSPLDKGKTNAASVSSWLLRTVFAPLNDTARYVERPQKAAWDIVFVGGAIVLALLAFAFALLMALWSLATIACLNGGGGSEKCIYYGGILSQLFASLQLLTDPKAFIGALNGHELAAFGLGIVALFLLFQALRATISLLKNRRQLSSERWRVLSRAIVIFVLLVLGLLGVWGAIGLSRVGGSALTVAIVGLALGVLASYTGRELLVSFIVQFFGDVQIYTTRDENSGFYVLRAAILARVKEVILETLLATGAVEYDRIYVYAHSLGSTIALDAILHLYQQVLSGQIERETFEKIRGFVTFGTALEKTKYFFDATNLTMSQEYEQWRGDLYGPLFTKERSVLEFPNAGSVIFWLNCWYFSDPIADELGSYRSFVPAGQPPSAGTACRARAQSESKGHRVRGRLVALNRERFGNCPQHLVTHGDYLGDSWFWRSTGDGDVGALDVVVAGTDVAGSRPVVRAEVAERPSVWQPSEPTYEICGGAGSGAAPSS